ncbi:MAG: Mur ligase family protein [Nitrospiraceae bacterium]
MEKTTTTYVVKEEHAGGRSAGMWGSSAPSHILGIRNHSRFPYHARRPGIASLFARMVTAKLDSAVMEVSSHALALDRTAGAEFDVAVFTNLTQDHLDFHVDMESYFQAKRRLFSELGQGGNNRDENRPSSIWTTREEDGCGMPARLRSGPMVFMPICGRSG